MKNMLMSTVVAAMLVVSMARAQDPPDIHSQAQTAEQSVPVVAPLGVGTAFNATLITPLDARRNKAGDPVTAEVTENVSYVRELVFPKGTKIVGHVVKASSNAHGANKSALFVQFDKAILKNGQEVMMSAGIQALMAKSGPGGEIDTPADVEPKTGEIAVKMHENKSTAEGMVEVSSTTDLEPRRITTGHGTEFVLPAVQGGLDKHGMITADSQGAIGAADMKVYTPLSAGSDGTVLMSTRKNVRLDVGTKMLIVIQPPPSVETN